MSFYVKNGDGGDGIERGEEEVRTSVIYGWSCTFDRMSMYVDLINYVLLWYIFPAL